MAAWIERKSAEKFERLVKEHVASLMEWYPWWLRVALRVSPEKIARRLVSVWFEQNGNPRMTVCVVRALGVETRKAFFLPKTTVKATNVPNR